MILLKTCTVYRRTVLVIWPSTCHIGNGGGDRRAVFALDKLAACEQPTADDEELFEYVLESQSLPRAKACETLCATARRWRRPDLWQTTLLVFGNGNSPDEMFAAVASFGFDAVKDGSVPSCTPCFRSSHARPDSSSPCSGLQAT